MTLGQRLKSKRRELKLTQKELATKLGIDHTTVSKWESDTYEPDTDTLNKLADLFGVTVDFLLGRTQDQTSDKEINKSSNLPEKIDPNINVAYLGGVKHELTPEVAKRLKEDIELFERLKKQFLEDKKNEKK